MYAYAHQVADEAAPVPRIVLHLGAHKTASTHFARTMRRSEAAVRHFNLAVPTKQDVRNLITRRISEVRPHMPLPEEHQGITGQLTAGRRMAYLCEENVLGTTQRIFSEGMMYPRAERRLRRALHLLPDAQVELMIAIRHPGSFAISSYGETVRFHGFQPFSAFMGDCSHRDIRWAPLIKRLLRAARNRRIIVWRFESYARVLPSLLCHVADTSPADAPMFRQIGRVVRRGLSQRAIEEIKAVCEGGDAPVSPRVYERIVRKFPKSDEFPAPDPWTADQKGDLDAQYAEDIEELRRMRHVEFFDEA